MAGVKWEFKKRFLYELEVPQRLRNDPNTNIYRCDYCHNLHVGHNTPIDAKDTKLHRAVIDLSQTGSVIKRHRESKKIDKKSLAKKMKIPAMRITEIEEGKKEARADILFDLLRELRLIVELKSKS